MTIVLMKKPEGRKYRGTVPLMFKYNNREKVTKDCKGISPQKEKLKKEI
jgi:hypothetical protein